MKQKTTCAGAFEVARPADIGLLVEAGLELDQRRHRLAGLGGVDQGAHDRAVVRRAVKRLLDGDDFRIARCLQQELHDHVEGLVGVMHHHVLLADRRQAVAGMLAHALGETRIVRLEAQIVAWSLGDFGQSVECQQSRQDGDPVFRDAQFLHDELAQRRRHLRIGLDADHRTAATALQRGLEKANEVFRLFFHLDIAVANDAEGTGAFDLIARKQPVDELADHVFEGDVADDVLDVGQPDEAVECHRQTQERRHWLAAGLADELQAHRKAEVRNEGERMRRVDGERCQHWEDRLIELVGKPAPVLHRKRGRANDQDVFLGEILLKHGERGLLLHLQIVDFLQDVFELLDRGLAVGRTHREALAHLAFEAGDAHHEELVEVGGRDRQKANTLQQRMRRVQRFLEHAAIELQPGKFAVDEALRARQQVDVLRRCLVFVHRR
jgi:hypothetical protein